MVSELDRQKSMAYDIMTYAMQHYKIGLFGALEIGVASVSNSRLKVAFGDIKDRMIHGEGFYDIMKEYTDVFHNHEINAIRKGEREGKIDRVLRDLVEKLKI